MLDYTFGCEIFSPASAAASAINRLKRKSIIKTIAVHGSKKTSCGTTPKEEDHHSPGGAM
jgi:hypothetical protein